MGINSIAKQISSKDSEFHGTYRPTRVSDIQYLHPCKQPRNYMFSPDVYHNQIWTLHNLFCNAILLESVCSLCLICAMEEGELGFVCSPNAICSEDTDNATTCQQIGEASFAVSTYNSAGVDQFTVPSSIPQRLEALPQNADALHKWNDSHHVGTSTAADPSQEENGQCSGKGPDATCNASEQLGSDCLRLEGTGIIAEGIASVLGPVMKEFDGRAEGALKSQGILASSIDRLTRELDKLLDDAPIPFIIQHATKISGVRKRVLSLNSTLQRVQRRIDNIERMLSGQVLVAASGSSSQDSLQRAHTLTSKGLENGSSSQQGESQQGESLTNDQSEHDGPDSFEADHM